MRLSLDHTCAACGARIAVRGARAFTPLPCPACGAKFRARAEIGGYRLGEIMARSGLGVIFRATDLAGAELAVKVLQPPFAAESVDVEYFVSEVWALARLNHAHCVRIFAAGVDHGLAWIAMEWLPGGSLAARLAARGKLREAEVLAIGLQVAEALDAAFAAGHLHRAITPENIVFADPRTVKVTDFGQGALYQISANDLGTMWGRGYHVAPERLRNEFEEAASDIYALGTVLFAALAGVPLHNGDPHPLTVLERIENGPLHVEQLLPGIHEKTAQVLQKMLLAEPAQRFQHWSEVVAQLSQAGTLVARRDAALATPATATRPPLKHPEPKSKAAPVPRRGKWFAIAGAIALATGAVALIKWKTVHAAPEIRVEKSEVSPAPHR